MFTWGLGSHAHLCGKIALPVGQSLWLKDGRQGQLRVGVAPDHPLLLSWHRAPWKSPSAGPRDPSLPFLLHSRRYFSKM